MTRVTARLGGTEYTAERTSLRIVRLTRTSSEGTRQFFVPEELIADYARANVAGQHALEQELQSRPKGHTAFRKRPEAELRDAVARANREGVPLSRMLEIFGVEQARTVHGS